MKQSYQKFAQFLHSLHGNVISHVTIPVTMHVAVDVTVDDTCLATKWSLFGVWVARETSCAAMHCFTQGHSVTSCAPARPVFMWNTVERCSMLRFLVCLSSSWRVFPTLVVRAFGALQNMLE
jgi:hypothetical protein